MTSVKQTLYKNQLSDLHELKTTTRRNGRRIYCNIPEYVQKCTFADIWNKSKNSAEQIWPPSWILASAEFSTGLIFIDSSEFQYQIYFRVFSSVSSLLYIFSNNTIIKNLKCFHYKKYFCLLL